jgi:DNA-binding transcriptional regulator GbsR (MarR family)
MRLDPLTVSLYSVDTEIGEHSMLPLSPVAKKFVLHWGEMGSAWGINRSVAQVHALLYASPEPLNAEDLAGALEMARSNVSTSLKELQTWGLIRVVHTIGDRRDHYESLTDVWEMFKIVLAERHRREVEPTLRLLRECVAELGSAGKSGREEALRSRLGAMLDFLEITDGWYLQMRKLPTAALIKMFKLGAKIQRFFVGA